MDKDEKEALIVQLKKHLYEYASSKIKENTDEIYDKMMQAMGVPKWIYEIPIEENGEKIILELEIDDVEENKDGHKRS